jgi:hypothetical protein
VILSGQCRCGPGDEQEPILSRMAHGASISRHHVLSTLRPCRVHSTPRTPFGRSV